VNSSDTEGRQHAGQLMKGYRAQRFPTGSIHVPLMALNLPYRRADDVIFPARPNYPWGALFHLAVQAVARRASAALRDTILQLTDDGLDTSAS
jgi:hypothetical protein